MDGKTFSGWCSVYEGMGKTVLAPLFTEGGDDSGDDGPLEKVKNWIKGKVKAFGDKLKGLFTIPKVVR